MQFFGMRGRIARTWEMWRRSGHRVEGLWRWGWYVNPFDFYAYVAVKA